MVHPFATWMLAALTAGVLVAQDPKPAPVPAPTPAPAEKTEKPTTLKVGDPLPAGIALRGIDGKVVEFDKLRGKVIVLHFWSTTCPYEELAEPKLNALSAGYADKGVVMLGVAANAGEIGEQPAATAFDAKDEKDLPYGKLRAKAKASGCNHGIVVDHGGDVLGKPLQAKTTPHCYVIDQKGVLRYAGGLDDDGHGEKGADAQPFLKNAIDDVLAGNEVAKPTTKPYG
ncbi:MAG: redoxin domain-containing protein [Planctomycetes bacterium]|nr:redoxin domain-containing protein [Planctomycetota bacterium]